MSLSFVPGLSLSLLLTLGYTASAQSVKISEEERIIKTYPFSDPNPIPILTTKPDIYPYHKFEGYSTEGQDQTWKVVTLENDYIQVSILPEVGGKVWGAIEKSTGEEFIYRNEVLKFRNIAMRGPWTSGGIEFNFGVIGHSPATATPVDYIVQEHDDGSVSCTVGTIDLPSRTQWRVRITLAPDQAYFTTNATWYNPTATHQAYYNWMTAAAQVRPDLEFFYPGHLTLKHSGEALPWPIDKAGQDLAWYRNNNFGPSKSYHIVGAYHNHFGGYWHDTQVGFGHWAHHDEMLGQKLWLWAQSRSGGIWEDLLTDTDGQYMEFQAGRLFNQFSPEPHRNPISKVTFAPHTTDQWRELWFPFKDIDGLTNVSPTAAMNVTEADGKLTVGINALRPIDDTLKVMQNGQILHRKAVVLAPMETQEISVAVDNSEDTKVTLADLTYRSAEQATRLQRSFVGEAPPLSPADSLYQAGVAAYRVRQYPQAAEQLAACLEAYPAHHRARVALAELRYRQGAYEVALEMLQPALIADTYDYDANYVAGIVYRTQGELLDALESLGLAARSPTYRSAAYVEMAQIMLRRGDYPRAKAYARQARDYNQRSVGARQSLAVALRRQGSLNAAQEVLTELLDIDPLNHFARFEQYLLDRTSERREAFSALIRHELPYQTYLEIAMDYRRMGQTDAALAVLQIGPDHPLVNLWLAYLTRDQPDKSNSYLAEALVAPPDFVFPFRRETQAVLDWAQAEQDHWKLHYYRGLTHWAVGQLPEAVAQFRAVSDRADYTPFYLARAELLRQVEGRDEVADVERALAMDSSRWRTWHQLLDYYHRQERTDQEQILAKRAYRRFPNHYVIGMDYARALLRDERYAQAARLLDSLEVLPYEGAKEGRTVFEQAYLRWAMQQLERQQYDSAVLLLQTSLDWPENLGVGQPYDPDTRPQDYLLAHIYRQLGKTDSAQRYQQRVVDVAQPPAEASPYDLLTVLARRSLNQSDEADELLRRMKENQEPLTQWAAAYAANSGNRTADEALARDETYVLLRQLLRLTEE